MAQRIVVTQNDSGIDIVTNLIGTNGLGIEIGDATEVTVRTVTPSGRVIEELANLNVSQSTARITLSEDHTAEEGLHTMYWTIGDGFSTVTAQEEVNYYVREYLGGNNA